MSLSSPESCSPRRDSSNKHETCFSYQSLKTIAKKFNQFNPDNRIPISSKKCDLWKEIQKRIPNCDSEKCWVTRNQTLTGGEKKKLLLDFKPPIPEGKHAWLNSDDIDRVMDRYEQVFPDFRYLGTFPIDFRHVMPEAVVDVKDFLRQRSVKHIGMVLNLDRHDQPGSHWVAVFIDKPRKTFEYFDSFADPTPTEVKAFRREFFSDYKFKENSVAHQRQNSECGNYSIHFLVQRMSGKSFKQVTETVIRDTEMNAKRLEFFDPNDSYDNSI